jgi:NADP-dependent 3-hydroxy acid dehydrogenase YdfG
MTQAHKKRLKNHMAVEVCFIAGATCGTDTEIAKTRLCDGHRVETTGRKPADVTSYSSAFLAGTLDVERKDQLEMAAVLPIIAVVFTVGGPVVYEQGHHLFP